MHDLRVIGVEDGAILLTAEDGREYRLSVDDALQSRIRQAIPAAGAERRISPREIQAHIRSGMSAHDVASVTGAPLEYIERFEGPVLAEREFIVSSALAVAVHTALEVDPEASGSTFGSAIEQRLTSLGASDERWSSWKEESGWVVKLSFVADEIDHDARWRFDPKKAALTPLDNEAVQLSTQGDSPTTLIPRLRAVGSEGERESDSSRFDSGAFLLESDVIPSAPRPQRAAAAAPDDAPSNQTADLLEALRRRRGEREAANYELDIDDAAPSDERPASGTIRLVDVHIDETTVSFDDFLSDISAPDATAPESGPQPIVHAKGARKGRAAMPSWDDIVFGARHDDDPA